MKKFLGFIILFLCLIDAFFIEPNLISIKNYNIQDENLKNLKIVFISDLHLRKNEQKRVQKIVKMVNEQNPDIVLSTGDFLNGSDPSITLEPKIIAEELSKINSKYGFYTSLGNHDCVIDDSELIRSFQENNLNVLKNSNIYIKEKNLYIAGIEDDKFGNPDLDKALENTKMPRILLMHGPDCYDKLEQNVTLTLAGHNHGGQICIPFIGPLFLPSETKRKYAYGFYNDGYKKMIVTKGLGNSIINARFNCLPEIVVINFK